MSQTAPLVERELTFHERYRRGPRGGPKTAQDHADIVAACLGFGRPAHPQCRRPAPPGQEPVEAWGLGADVPRPSDPGGAPPPVRHQDCAAAHEDLRGLQRHRRRHMCRFCPRCGGPSTSWPGYQNRSSRGPSRRAASIRPCGGLTWLNCCTGHGSPAGPTLVVSTAPVPSPVPNADLSVLPEPGRWSCRDAVARLRGAVELEVSQTLSPDDWHALAEQLRAIAMELDEMAE